jgi:hypothetical protein
MAGPPVAHYVWFLKFGSANLAIRRMLSTSVGFHGQTNWAEHPERDKIALVTGGSRGLGRNVALGEFLHF